MNPLLQFDLRAIANRDRLIGVDEAGRGALAGPVVAAAVALSDDFYRSSWCRRHVNGINDSKKLTAAQREALYAEVMLLKKEGLAGAEVGVASVKEIERANVLGATRLAMQRALEALTGMCAEAFALLLREREDGLFQNKQGIVFQGGKQKSCLPCFHILVDGKPLRPFPYKHQAIVKGDGRSLAIALASIVAKVKRDSLMCDLDREYSQYGFAEHKGYATPKHQAIVLRTGPSSEHRLTFLRKLLRFHTCKAQLELRF